MRACDIHELYDTCVNGIIDLDIVIDTWMCVVVVIVNYFFCVRICDGYKSCKLVLL